MPKKFNKLNPFGFCDVETYMMELFLPISNLVLPGIYDYYCISTYGRVWHRYLCKFISPGINGAGYPFFMASTESGPKPVQIHRAVMITFNYISNHDEYEVNHEDGNKCNNRIDNLTWMTHKENVDHAYRTGLQKNNENHWNSTITNEQAVQICELLQENKYFQKEIANIVGCNENVVSSIKKRESWANISQNYIFQSRPGKLFDETMIRNICIYFENNHIGNLTVNDHCRNALSFCGYDNSEKFVDTARKIYTRKYYTNISCDYKF